VQSYKDGIQITIKQLSSVFEKFNITEVNPVGEKFNPNKHQAISMLENSGEPNTVTSVLQKGYTLNERVLRPALVMVAK
jgi:molecular chaperone GrpE